jgi:hypothetical protein
MPEPVLPRGELVKLVRKHAEKLKYSFKYKTEGWDQMEIWTDVEVDEAMGASKTKSGAIWAVRTRLQLLADFRREALAGS